MPNLIAVGETSMCITYGYSPENDRFLPGRHTSYRFRDKRLFLTKTQVLQGV